MDTSLPRTTTILDILNAFSPDAPVPRFCSAPAPRRNVFFRIRNRPSKCQWLYCAFLVLACLNIFNLQDLKPQASRYQASSLQVLESQALKSSSIKSLQVSSMYTILTPSLQVDTRSLPHFSIIFLKLSVYLSRRP
jgi:hypothetical protein